MGNILSTSGSLSDTLGKSNPLRYRGYVFDQDTGLYYLQSRYYDPEMGRFINADAFTSTGQGLLGNNMYAYCGNNPANYSDPNGCYIVPLPSIADYYHMHKAVQYDVVEQHGYGMEVYVIGSKGIGRLDLYDGTCNTYYEVKHQPAATGKIFDDQMTKYDNSHVTGWRFSEYQIEGNVVRGDNHISGWTTYLYWDIKYWKAADGVIVYIWEVNETRYAQHMCVLATAFVAASLDYANSKTGGAPQGVKHYFLDY